MNNKNILLKLQKAHKDGGYALVAPKSGKVHAFSNELKKLYQLIDKKNIDDSGKMVMYVPPPNVSHVFQISLSIRLCRRT